jgi:hypothetical protein
MFAYQVVRSGTLSIWMLDFDPVPLICEKPET